MWGSDWDGLFARDTQGALARAFAHTVDGQMQTFAAKDGRFNRDNFFGQDPELARLAQGMTDLTLEGATALSAVKSLNEAAEIQTKYAKAAIEKAVAESAKMQEAVFKLAEQAVAPISARMTVAMEKMAKPLAA